MCVSLFTVRLVSGRCLNEQLKCSNHPWNFILDKNVVIWFVFYFCFGVSLCHNRDDYEQTECVNSSFYLVFIQIFGSVTWLLDFKVDINAFEIGNFPKVSWDNLLHTCRNQTAVQKFSSKCIFCNNWCRSVELAKGKCFDLIGA